MTETIAVVLDRIAVSVTALMLDCLIAATAGYDPHPTGRDLVILGLPLAVKLRESVSG
jgi:hypothetical protein